jgi:hypothetical protein
VLCAIDVGVTIAYQPDRYWRESYRFAHDATPLAQWLLEIGPAAMVAGASVWILAFWATLCRLRFDAARMVALAILLGHALGASTWLVWQPYGWARCLAVWAVARWLFGRFWDEPEP